ncbi:O-antigen ligase family protein [Changchengzhania lutea]|uniref:O-antigen ligase family protein n=1 Tax=Changchengzhania lutea TaxID=2049305 RepID=UPI00115E7E13|nr:O-antigen ligase family protein [Changchengzhania lutea]
MNLKAYIRFLSTVSGLVFILILATPFVKSGQFVNTILTPKLIWFSATCTLFIILSFLVSLTKPSDFKFLINRIDIAVLLFFLYLHINQFFTGLTYISSKASVATVCLLIYITLRLKLSTINIDKIILKLIPVPYILALITVLIGFYQYFFSATQINELLITAAMGNSGAVASYLAILLPWMIIFANTSKREYRRFLYCGIIILSIVLLILTKARAAWIAVIISYLFILIVNNKTEIKKIARQQAKTKYIFIIAFIAFFCFSLYAIFNLKKDSANGRLFIWKRTIELISDHPFTGVGYNLFGSVYPTYQANYLKSNPQDPLSLLANDVNHTFNEYLYIAAELGLIGFILFLSILLLLIKPFKDHLRKINKTLLACYGGVFVFCILSFFTYPFKIYSVQLLFIICIAIISSTSIKNPVFSINNRTKIILSAFLCGIALLIVSSELQRLKKERLWFPAYNLRTELSWNTRSRIFERLYEYNQDNWDFLNVYGAELAANGSNKKAIEVLEKATDYMKTSEIYTTLGMSYEEVGDFKNSRNAYEMSIHIVPHKFFPKYRLVYLYKKMGMLEKALQLAKTIIITPAKVKSSTVTGIKYEMREFIKENNYE